MKFRLVKIILVFLLTGSAIISCTSATRFSSPTPKNHKMIKQPVQSVQPGSVITQSDLWKTATSWLGVPYRYGGTDHTGIDCSALTGHIYREVYGIELPRTVADMVKGGKPVSGYRFKAGDLLFFKNTRTGPVDHVGIYLGEGRFIHSSTSSGVIISDSNSEGYRRLLITARRYVH